MSFLTNPEIVRHLQAERERELNLDVMARLAERAVRCCRHGLTRTQRLRAALHLPGGAR